MHICQYQLSFFSHKTDVVGYVDIWLDTNNNLRYTSFSLHFRNKVEYSRVGQYTYSLCSMTGTIKRLTDRGFGFIDANTGKDLFFHANELVGMQYNELNEGDRVTFEITESPKGPQASQVRRG